MKRCENFRKCREKRIDSIPSTAEIEKAAPYVFTRNQFHHGNLYENVIKLS